MIGRLLSKTPHETLSRTSVIPDWRIDEYSNGAGHTAAVMVSDTCTRKTPAKRIHETFEQGLASTKDLGRIAIDYGDAHYTYSDLKKRSDAIAAFLAIRGVGSGDRVALLLERSIDLYASILALSKLGAAFVPLDPSFPPERLSFILKDASVGVILTTYGHERLFVETNCEVIIPDEHRREIEKAGSQHRTFTFGLGTDPLAYIIYTSGSTGRPKGVPVRHSAICAFLTAAADLYGYQPEDRVYQGLTLAFDYAFEEVWVPLLVGATLVPAPPAARLVGEDLAEFLRRHRVTALCTVPTILATLPADLAQIRLLVISGEACHVDIVAPWFCPERRILNLYGPTETTVSATWEVMKPDGPITIGGPLPGYAIVIIDPETETPVTLGHVGEICIGGTGVFEGYLNRPDQTKRALIEDFIGLPVGPTGTLYRTGDLGRFTPHRRLEYLGRIDDQVKIRGYRIETGEIEVIARSSPTVGRAVVVARKRDGEVTLLAYLTPNVNGTSVDVAEVDATLRAALPDYMVPSYYEILDEIPVLASGKADRNALPEPLSPRFVSNGTYVAPTSETELHLERMFKEVLQVERVSADADFFDDLGIDSLTLATYVTRIRSDMGIKKITMRKLYENPSIGALGVLIDGMKPAPKPTTGLASSAVAISTRPAFADNVDLTSLQHKNAPYRASLASKILMGSGQFLVFVVASFVLSLSSLSAFQWVTSANTFLPILGRAVLATNLIFFGTGAALIALKWIAIGRFRLDPISLWSFGHFRFWIAQIAIRVNPFTLFVGTPLYGLFLRGLGMKVGRHANLLSLPPTCTDLICIGENSVVRQDCILQGYTVRDGYIYPGRVDIGRDVLVCDAVVLDINSTVGDFATIGTNSALPEGQSIPESQTWQGCPAEPSESVFDRAEPLPRSSRRAVTFALWQLAGLIFITLPAGIIATVLFVGIGFNIAQPMWTGDVQGLLVDIGVLAAFTYLGGILIVACVVLVFPRILNFFIQPEHPHPVYGVQYELARAMTRLTNSRFLNTLFGDSSMIVYWLSAVGYDLRRSTQTGSNFGVDQRHHSPFLCAFDRNTLVSDGLRMLNMEVSSSSFRLRQITMPPDTYVGNVVHYPADSTLGSNCLIATKAALPIDGAERQDVGLLGSPSFEIPRSVTRDQRFDHFKMPGIFEKRLSMKLRSNLITLALYIIRSWFLTALGFGLALVSVAYSDLVLGTPSLIGRSAALVFATSVFLFAAPTISILFERTIAGFRRLQPQYCSLYDRKFWAHERFWKLNYNVFLNAFNGTPIKPFFLRLQGARVGQNVFDDGAGLTEPSMVEIGNNTTLNYHSILQCHSLEDGTFKSDTISVGADCTLGVNAFVHYGARIHDEASVEADAFVMKGTTIEAGTHWLGNPARDSASKSNEHVAKLGA